MLKAKIDLVGPKPTAQGSSWLYFGTFQKDYKEKSSSLRLKNIKLYVNS